MYSKIEIIILGLLSKRPAHGYDLNREFNELPISKYLKISPISIYKGLERLANKGLIDPRVEKVGKMPERTVYQVNKNGLSELKIQMQVLLSEGLPDNFDIYAALLFIDCLDKEEMIAALKERGEIINQVISELEKALDDRKERLTFPYRTIIQHHTLYYETELDWTKKTLRNIKNQKN